MKTKKDKVITIILLIALVSVITIAVYASFNILKEYEKAKENNPYGIKIDLPEEYQLINRFDNLKGYYDDENTLHIYFNDDNNGQVFIWNDDEESIPKEKSLIKIEKIDKNVIYLSPIE